LSPRVLSPPTPPTPLHPLSLHDALPIFIATPSLVAVVARASLDLAVSAAKTDWMNTSGEVTITTLDTTKAAGRGEKGSQKRAFLDRKSTRLNSSHRTISYAVFCLKKKKK